MAISSSHFDVALHEAKQSAFGTSVGFSLTAVYVDASGGHAIWGDDFPVPEELAQRWSRDPEATTALVRHAIWRDWRTVSPRWAPSMPRHGRCFGGTSTAIRSGNRHP